MKLVVNDSQKSKENKEMAKLKGKRVVKDIRGPAQFYILGLALSWAVCTGFGRLGGIWLEPVMGGLSLFKAMSP